MSTQETSSRGYPNSIAFKMAAVYEGNGSGEKNVLVELLQPQDCQVKMVATIAIISGQFTTKRVVKLAKSLQNE